VRPDIGMRHRQGEGRHLHGAARPHRQRAREAIPCGSPLTLIRKFSPFEVSGLARAGVASDRIHYEFFRPADELLAA
jgi:ferredoxin-NADP reductase